MDVGQCRYCACPCFSCKRNASARESTIGVTPAIRVWEGLSLPPAPWASREPAQIGPPPVYSNYNDRASWIAISEAISLLIDKVHNDTVADWTGMAPGLIPKIQARMNELALRTGINFGNTGTTLHKPRQLDTTKSLWSLLETADDRLLTIANEWASLASRVPISAGCPLLDETAVSELLEVVGSRGFRLSEVSGQPVTTYMFATTDGKEVYGIWPTLRWILAVAWVAGRLPIKVAD